MHRDRRATSRLMKRLRHLDDATADRLLCGIVDPADAPPPYAEVVAVLRAAAVPGPPVDPSDPLLAAMVAAVAAGAPTPARRNRMISKVLTTKIAAAGFGALVLSAGGAAAATGTLPDVAQDKVASIASHVGVELPDTASDTAKAVHKALETTPPGPARGKAVSAAAKGSHGIDSDDIDDDDDAVTGKAQGQAHHDAAKERVAAKKKAHQEVVDAKKAAAATKSEADDDDEGVDDTTTTSATSTTTAEHEPNEHASNGLEHAADPARP